MIRGYKTCLVHHISKGLCVVPKEAADRVSLILTREDHFDQRGEFVQSECASDQTSGGYTIEVEKVGVISTLQRIGEGGAEDVPPPAPDVGMLGEGTVASKAAFGALRVLSISWILSFCPSTLALLCLMRCAFAPLLRVRSISPVTLEFVGEGAGRTRRVKTPFQILECQPHGFVIRITLGGGLQHLAYIETVFGQLHGIFVIDQLVLVIGEISRVYRREENGALTRTKARVALTVLKTCFAEEASSASLFKISILSSRSDALRALCVRGVISAGLV